MTIITTGDHSKIPVTLKRDGATFSIDAGATIKAILTGADRITLLTEEVTIDNAAVGTDLPNSKFIVEFTKAQTLAIIDYGPAYLEVQVEEIVDEPDTWTDEVLIRKGNIA